MWVADIVGRDSADPFERRIYEVEARLYEAQQYEGKLREGNILMAVHVEDSDEAATARKILTEEKAESISTGSEAGVPSR